nr:MAG: internal scaffolding protein [Microvirus sp.]
MKFKTRYTATRSPINPNALADTGEILESLTRQEHKDECDINSILARYDRTGDLPPSRPGAFVNCSSVSYQESLQIVSEANQLFSELPVRVREMYGNSPALFLDAFDRKDPELLAAAQKYGMIPQPKADELTLLQKIVDALKPAEKPGAGDPT